MVNVLVTTESRFPVDRKLIKLAVEKTLGGNKHKGNVEVEVTVVGDRKMRGLNRTFRHLDETTDVLSFPLDDPRDAGKFIQIDDGILHLGSVVISYPQARQEAAEENVLVDEQIGKLVEHGVLHLLGIHHEE